MDTYGGPTHDGKSCDNDCRSAYGSEEGVKSIVPLVHFMGYMAQDLALVRLQPRLMREYLDKSGYSDVIVPGHLWFSNTALSHATGNGCRLRFS